MTFRRDNILNRIFPFIMISCGICLEYDRIKSSSGEKTADKIKQDAVRRRQEVWA